MPDRTWTAARRGATAIAALTLLGFGPGAARAADSGMTFGGEAPLVCTARLSPGGSAATGARALGQLSAFCNDPRGFQVWVDYPDSLANAQLQVDGALVTLAPGGATRIEAASAPGLATHSLTLQTTAAGNLTVRIVPL